MTLRNAWIVACINGRPVHDDVEQNTVGPELCREAVALIPDGELRRHPPLLTQL